MKEIMNACKNVMINLHNILLDHNVLSSSLTGHLPSGCHRVTLAALSAYGGFELSWMLAREFAWPGHNWRGVWGREESLISLCQCCSCKMKLILVLAFLSVMVCTHGPPKTPGTGTSCPLVTPPKDSFPTS